MPLHQTRRPFRFALGNGRENSDMIVQGAFNALRLEIAEPMIFVELTQSILTSDSVEQKPIARPRGDRFVKTAIDRKPDPRLESAWRVQENLMRLAQFIKLVGRSRKARLSQRRALHGNAEFIALANGLRRVEHFRKTPTITRQTLRYAVAPEGHHDSPHRAAGHAITCDKFGFRHAGGEFAGRAISDDRLLEHLVGGARQKPIDRPVRLD